MWIFLGLLVVAFVIAVILSIASMNKVKKEGIEADAFVSRNKKQKKFKKTIANWAWRVV